jgi:hypothetical protein
MRRALHSAVLVALLSLAALPAAAGDRVFLMYDEQQIDDASRADLINALCYILPPPKWRRVKVEQAATVNAIIDRYYDYWDNPTKAENPYPNTTMAIARSIRRGNKNVVLQDDVVPAGTELRIPPLPVRGQWANKLEFHIRVYDPVRQAYEMLDRPFEEYERIPVPSVVTDAPANLDHPFREARLTLFEIPDWKEFIARLENDEVPVPTDLPNSAVLVKGEQKVVELDFFDSECPAPAATFSELAQLKRLRVEIDRYRAALPNILAANTPVNLWIVDWNFKDGHGKRVAEVVDEILDALDLCELKKFVKTFELNPHLNRDGLKDALAQYRTYYEKDKNFDKNIGPVAFETAESWIKNPPAALATGDTQVLRMNEFVVQAVFWKFLYNTPKWVNMSFTTRDPQTQVLNSIFMADSVDSTLAFVAAGNDLGPVPPGEFPQAGAAVYKNIFNVTFGRGDGFVEGARTRPDDAISGVPVYVVGPNCFVLADGHNACGSSFASPFVAVTSWLKHVITHDSPAQMLASLRRANRPAGFAEKMVESRGRYEPALLFADNVEPHLVTADGQRFSLLNATIELRYTAVNGNAPQSWGPVTIAAATGRGLAIYNDPTNGLCVWFKDEDQKPEYVKLISLTITGAGAVDAWTPADFVTKSAELFF